MDKNVGMVAVKEKIGGLELRPVRVDDVFYHDVAGKLCFKYLPNSDELVLIDPDFPKQTINYETVIGVLKHSSWMEKDIEDTVLQEMLTAIDSAGHIVNAAGSADLKTTLIAVGLEFTRLTRSNKSWRNEYLASLEYATSIEMLVSSMFKEVSYLKSNDERIGHVLFNIKKLVMLLNDKHRTLDKAHTQLTSDHDAHNAKYDELNDRFIKAMAEWKTENLSQKIVFNSIMAPLNYDLDSAKAMLDEQTHNALKLKFLDEIEDAMRKGKPLKVIRTELAAIQ